MKVDYDLIIIGGGHVGLTLACALGTSGLKIAVVSNTISSFTPDQRVSAITRASQHIFEKLDVWSAICADRISPYQHMQVWEGNGGGSIEFNCEDLGEVNLGYIIENHVIQKALLNKIQHDNSIDLITPVQLTSLVHTPEKQIVQLNDGRTFSCRLVVGADGAHSKVREYMGVSMSQSDYDQVALVTTVRTELPHRETARQIFLPTGPLAFLPLADPHTCSIVWSTLPSHAEQLLQMPSIDFKTALAQAFEYRLGGIESVIDLLSFPLRMQHVDDYVKPGMALIGDAAHTLHPLAGQGVNLGLLDAACLAEVLLDALNNNRDIALLSILRRYERWRKGHNWAMIVAVQGFKSLFESPHYFIQKIRQQGLQITDSVPVLKHLLMRHAMGLVGDLPRMCNREYA